MAPDELGGGDPLLLPGTEAGLTPECVEVSGGTAVRYMKILRAGIADITLDTTVHEV